MKHTGTPISVSVAGRQSLASDASREAGSADGRAGWLRAVDDDHLDDVSSKNQVVPRWDARESAMQPAIHSAEQQSPVCQPWSDVLRS